MTEHNLFCYSEDFGDNNSFQQKKWRAFNKEVGEKRYQEILLEVKEILSGLKLNLDENGWSKEWGKVTPEQWEKLLSIPEAKDFKDGLEFITGIKLPELQKPKQEKRGRPRLSVEERIKRMEKELKELKMELK